MLAALSAPSSLHEALSLGIGLLQVALAAVAGSKLLRYGRRFPWLVLLSVFFAARGVDRVYVAFSDHESALVSFLSDAVIVGILLLLIVGLDDTVAGLRRAERAADRRRSEYERALLDYRRLVRHRLANPLAILRGGVDTLALHGRELEPAAREELFDALRAQIDRLEGTALEPVATGPEEETLDPEPRARADTG